MKSQRYSEILRLMIAIFLPFIAWITQSIYWDTIKPFVWFLFFPAVFFSSWVAGFTGGVLATIISTLLVWWFFIPPVNSFYLENPANLASIIVFFIMGILFGYTQERIKKANQKTTTALFAAQSANDQLVEANDKITQLYEKTREIEQLKTQLFANVSHELRTPLTLILGPVQKILDGGRLQDTDKHDLEVVQRNSKLLYRHVSDLLDVSRLEAGRVNLHYVQVDIVHLIHKLALNFESLADDKKIDFQVDTPDVMDAQVDVEKFERVMLNLLSNAFKFTPVNGKIRVGANQHESQVVIRVEDNGPGIPEQMREIIFERFRQVEGGEDRVYGGTGLGLSIVKEFVGLHHGQVAAYAAEGGGALFIVTLPVMAPLGTEIHPNGLMADRIIGEQMIEELQSRSENTLRNNALKENKPVILVVEDNVEMNAFIAETLSRDYQVFSAFDGKEGLTRALENHPDLIISDVMMGPISGPQMLKEMRSVPELADIPVVMVSARADDQLRNELIHFGVQDYIYKPFSSEELLARISRLITDRQKMLDRIIDAYGLLHAVIEAIPDVIFVKDRNERYLMINQAGSKLIGLPVEQIVGKSDIDLFPAALAKSAVEEDQAVIALGEAKTTEKIISLDNKTHTFLSSKMPYYSPGGEVIGILGINRDISYQKNVENRIKKLNRLLSILSSINQSIVRIRDINQLFKNICQIAVEKGGFQLVWIGLLDETHQNLQPVAYFGKTDGFLSTLNISLLNNPLTYCPIDCALRGGSHFVCNGINQNKDNVECQRIALKMGFQSSASFPLMLAGKIRGTINLYSEDLNFFDDEELNLLDEMAEDISFAMEYADAEFKQKQSENLLRKRDELLNEMGRMAKIGGWEFDIETLEQVWTEEVYSIYEVDKTYKPTADKTFEFFVPDFRPEIKKAYKDIIESGKSFDLKLKLITARGNDRWVHVIGNAFQENSQTRKLSGFIQDITEQVNAEESLRFSEISFKELFENMLNGFAYCQMIFENDIPVDFVYLNVNNAFEKLTGLKNVIGKRVTEVIPDFYNSTIDIALFEIYGRVSISGVPEHFEIYLETLQMWFDVSVYSPKREYFVAVFDVVTERKLMEKALRESEERYRLIVETLSLGIVIHVDNKIVYGNPAALKLIGGEDMQSLLGRPVIEFVHPEDRPLVISLIQTAFSEGVQSIITNQQPIEERLIRVDGSIITIEASAVLINYYGNPALLVMMKDITVVKQKEDEIQKLNTELEQRVLQRTKQLENANKELEAFSYSVSHDLRAPLRAIDGFSRIVLDEHYSQLDEEGLRLLNIIQNNTVKMEQLITDLLSLSKTTRAEMNFSWIKMTDLVNTIYNDVTTPDIRSKFIFEISLLPDAYGDPSLIKQVWSNLLSNAIKYTMPKKERKIWVGSQIEKSRIVYYVKDNGVGFNTTDSNKLFEAFQRLHRSEEFEGTGVGLAIVQRIIKRHGGDVWAEGEVNQGATIYFSIPGI